MNMLNKTDKKITKTQLRRLLRDINNRTYDDQQISFEDLF